MSNAANTPKITWKDLKAQGVTRCCAMYRGGAQCRHRATVGDRPGEKAVYWCSKHGSTFQAVIAKAVETL